MNIIKKSYNVFFRWLMGGYPLCFTYWVTGVILNGIIALCFYSVSYQFDHELKEANSGMLIFIILVGLEIVLGPLTLLATAMSIRNYTGPMIWRILAMLAVIKGILSYISFCLQTVIEFTTV